MFGLELWFKGMWRMLTGGGFKARPFEHLHWDRTARRWRRHQEDVPDRAA